MKSFKYFFLANLLLFPGLLFASNQCSSSGYTVATINGVFTDKSGAETNMRALGDKVGETYQNQVIDYQYLLNPSHLGGIGDLAISVYQKLFESETVADYDLIEMLKDASSKVQTQKLLLVAHSQGNFYANSFYDTIVDKVGGVPAKALGVYSVANPASRVAGKGKWLTSDTDNVIAGLVSHLAPFHSIMPTNTHIAEVAGSWDPLAGHDFTQVYLKYRADDIVKDVQGSLDKLSSDLARREDTLCIDPPKISFAHKVEGAVLAVADPVANVGVTTVATTAKVGIFVVTTTVKAGVVATVWTYHAGVAVAVWTFDTGVAIATAVGNTAVAVASTVYDAVAGALTSKSIASNNMASVILATQTQTQPQVTQSSPLVSASNNKVPIVTQALPTNNQTTPVAPSQQQTVFVFEPKVQSGTNAPKLVFVGSFGGGATQVLGAQATVSGMSEVVTSTNTAYGAPVLSVPQCAQTLATDGCLLATTTIHFEWPAISGADYYLINKNGEHATTTDTSFDISARDFSDYTFNVVAVGADGQASATSTQAVSIATIPIAINEIAWMGTVASASAEWFELENNTAHTIDLSQWELNAKDGTPHVKLGGTIAPRAYLVFERTHDTNVSDVAAHQIYSGALGNAGEQLNLSYASTTLDQTPSGAWAAGYNSTTTRKTMERVSSKISGADISNWATNNTLVKNGIDANGNPIDGTPGAENSASIVHPTATSTATSTPAESVVDATEPTTTILSSDLNANGIPDADETDVVATSTKSLPAGEYHFHNLTVANNATVFMGGDKTSATSSDFLGVKIVADNLTVSAGASISADGMGYSTGRGSNAASYGGIGGGNTATSTYGSAIKPMDLGSGAGGSYRGGGAIRIVVADTLLNNGSISANGSHSWSSGGSVYATTNKLAGAGSFSANGAGTYWPYQYAGGGGRIAIHYQQSSFTGGAGASAGYYCMYGCNPAGGEGTVAFFDTVNNDVYPKGVFRFQANDGPFNFHNINVIDSASADTENGTSIKADSIIVQNNSALTLNDNVTVSANNLSITQNSRGTLNGAPSLNISAINIGRGSTVTLSGSETLVANSLNIQDGGTLTVSPEHILKLNIPNLTISAGSSISADSKGYGPGFGRGIPVTSLAGASYGGVGLWNTATSTYGSATAPVDFGSGGNGYHTTGGGAVRLVVTDTLLNNGSVSADGGNTSSGGSVYVTANTMSGSGSYHANGGGFYCPNSCVGMGGGGRVAIYYATSTFTGGAFAKGGCNSFDSWTMTCGGDGTAMIRNIADVPVVPPTVLSSAHSITSFNVLVATSTIAGVVDESAHTISVTVPFGTDIHALAPVVAVSNLATLSPASVVAQDFTNPVVYTVAAEDESTEEYTVTVSVAPAPIITPPTILSYTFNGTAGDITADFSTTTPTVTLVLTASEHVDWVSVTIEDQNNPAHHKLFYSGSGCVDGTPVCTKSWDGALSGGGNATPGETYRIKAHLKDVAGNSFNDYLSPYVITVI